MNKDLNLKSINIIPLVKKYGAQYSRHASFGVIIVILLTYAIVVFKIDKLANAEPSPDQEVVVTTSIPRIDSKAISQIQALENNNTDVHSLFEQARNNPFEE